jgi:hypothetical protein
VLVDAGHLIRNVGLGSGRFFSCRHDHIILQSGAEWKAANRLAKSTDSVARLEGSECRDSPLLVVVEDTREVSFNDRSAHTHLWARHR